MFLATSFVKYDPLKNFFSKSALYSSGISKYNTCMKVFDKFKVPQKLRLS